MPKTVTSGFQLFSGYRKTEYIILLIIGLAVVLFLVICAIYAIKRLVLLLPLYLCLNVFDNIDYIVFTQWFSSVVTHQGDTFNFCSNSSMAHVLLWSPQISFFT